MKKFNYLFRSETGVIEQLILNSVAKMEISESRWISDFFSVQPKLGERMLYALSKLSLHILIRIIVGINII